VIGPGYAYQISSLTTTIEEIDSNRHAIPRRNIIDESLRKVSISGPRNQRDMIKKIKTRKKRVTLD